MNIKKIINYILIIIIFPLIIYIGYKVFQNKNYKVIAIILALIACIPPFILFEKGKPGIAKMVMTAILVALAVASRCLFALTPGFKPITAIIVIAGLYFGGEVGFMVGALGALISNMFFGQGPWTPFQMLAWGFIGLFSGFLGHFKICKTWPSLIIIGVFSGCFFSLLLDVWTVLSYDNYFRFSRYLAVISLSVPFMITYMISNVIFLLLLCPSIGLTIERIKTKYGIIDMKKIK